MIAPINLNKQKQRLQNTKKCKNTYLCSKTLFLLLSYPNNYPTPDFPCLVEVGNRNKPPKLYLKQLKPAGVATTLKCCLRIDTSVLTVS